MEQGRKRLLTGALVASLPLAFGTVAFGQAHSEEQSGEECHELATIIHFSTSSAKIAPAAKDSLDEVASWLKGGDERWARVDGYTDPTGSTSSNQVLSEKRAQSVETYLEDRGVDPDRVETHGQGEALAGETPDVSSEGRVAVVTHCQPAPPAETPTAETPPPPPPEPTPPAEVAAPEPPPPAPAEAPVELVPATAGVSAQAMEPQPMSVFGVALTAGGGVTGFVENGARNAVDTGGTWDVRLTLGTRVPIGLDLAYVGSAQGMNVAGLDTDAVLIGNGAEAALRLQYPKGFVRPYLFGGIGWTHLSIQRTDAFITGVLRSDDEGVVPFGLGVAFGNVNGVTFDLRATGKAAFDDELLSGLQTASGQDFNMSTWAVTARIGGEF
jgi:hypothetical protein